MKTCLLTLSCGRTDLLVPSISSLLKTYSEFDSYILVDDSGNKKEQDLIKQWYPSWDIHFCHNGQAYASDLLFQKGLEKKDITHYVITEDDWLFNEDPKWFSDSIKILEEYQEVMLIGTSLPDNLIKYMGMIEFYAGVPVYLHKPWRIDEQHGQWFGWISQPRVMRRKDVELLPKFSDYLAEEVLDSQWWKLQYEAGRKSIWLAKAYCHHIGNSHLLYPQGDCLNPAIRTWLTPYWKETK